MHGGLQERNDHVIFQLTKLRGGGGAPLYYVPYILVSEFIHKVIKQMFPEHLLSAQHFSSSEQRDKNPTLLLHIII